MGGNWLRFASISDARDENKLARSHERVPALAWIGAI